MTHTDTLHDAGRLLAVCRSTAVKRGLSLVALEPSTLALLLAAFTQSVDRAERFSEKQINARLDAWLTHAGRMLRTDFAELRRILVDLQFFQRDGFGKVYQRAPVWPPAWQSLCTAVESTDLNGVLTAAQAEDADRRAQRKQQALASPAGPA